MKYLLLIRRRGPDECQPHGRRVRHEREFGAYHGALVKSGAYLGGERLRPTGTAKSVRVRDGKRWSSTAMPRPGATGRLYLIDVHDIDAAVDWAAKCPSARGGTIEVRPIWPTQGH